MFGDEEVHNADGSTDDGATVEPTSFYTHRAVAGGGCLHEKYSDGRWRGY